MATFYTIGHSNRPIDLFLVMLREAGIRVLVDVRTIPRSRHNPQFNAEALASALVGDGCRYLRIPELGGLRGRKKGSGPSLNSYWDNESFRNYADYADSQEFRAGFERLREIGSVEPCAIMCAEAVWWRCHRRIIADYLIARGETVVHLLDIGQRELAHLNEAAIVKPDGTLIYPGAQGSLALD